MKHISWLILILLQLSKVDLAQGQIPMGKYNDSYGRFLFFENDSIVSYKLPLGCRGCLKSTIAAIGLYKIHCDTIVLWTADSYTFLNSLDEDIPEWDSTKLSYSGQGQIFRYRFNGPNEMVLTGPIIENYEKLNRKRYRRRFWNWPWRWSFKEEHWFDPVSQILIKE
jgi:hypothetical protein